MAKKQFKVGQIVIRLKEVALVREMTVAEERRHFEAIAQPPSILEDGVRGSEVVPRLSLFPNRAECS